LGNIPIFVDSEPDIWSLSPHLLEKSIIDRKNGQKSKGNSFPVYLYGLPAKMKKKQAFYPVLINL